MRLVTYRSERGSRAGLLRDDHVVDIWDLLGGEPEIPGVRALLATGRVDELAGREGNGGVPLAQVELDVPVPDPEKIICIGLNYRAHAEEAGNEPPPSPTFFGKFHNALVPSGTEVRLPTASGKVDYEAEVAFVVGTRCHEISEQQALDQIAGYTLLNDLSARDLQFATPQWMPGKVFDGSAPCGPALVTPDEAGLHDGIGVGLTLNGEIMQQATTASLIFSVPALLAHLSNLMTLEPGDIISTGTPEGVGSARDPRVWLADGDQLVVSSPTLGRLETTIRR